MASTLCVHPIFVFRTHVNRRPSSIIWPLAAVFLTICSFPSVYAEEIDPLPTLRTTISDIPWDPASLDASSRVIYGADDRRDRYQVLGPIRLQNAAGVCGLIPESNLSDNGDGTFTIATSTYFGLSQPVCPSESFAAQPTAPYCSGFLAAPNIIVTAGHCFDVEDLVGIRFIFGFVMLDETTPVTVLDASQIYTGVEILGHMETPTTDYSVVRVDRVVTAAGAQPLPIRETGQIAQGTLLGIIGHPRGLPLKIAYGAGTSATDVTASDSFVSNLDSYGGNSGSPVFNGFGIVEGILIRGSTDFVANGSCDVSITLSNSPGFEVSTRVSTFASLIPQVDPANVFVDFDVANGYGTASSPFNNLADAVAIASEGATINMDTGTSFETFPAGISKALTLRNNTQGSGKVRIGGIARQSPDVDSGFVSRGLHGLDPGED